MNEDQRDILTFLADGTRQRKDDIRRVTKIRAKALVIELADLVGRGALSREYAVLDDYYTITTIGSFMLEVP